MGGGEEGEGGEGEGIGKGEWEGGEGRREGEGRYAMYEQGEILYINIHTQNQRLIIAGIVRELTVIRIHNEDCFVFFFHCNLLYTFSSSRKYLLRCILALKFSS
jgi:hypothetical protein